MSWGSLVLAVLKLVLGLVTWAREKQMLKAGQDQAIAQAALEVLGSTKTGKELRDKIAAMSDSEADALWSRMVEGKDAS